MSKLLTLCEKSCNFAMLAAAGSQAFYLLSLLQVGEARPPAKKMGVKINKNSTNCNCG